MTDCTYPLCHPQAFVDDLASVTSSLVEHGRRFQIMQDTKTLNWEVRVPPEDVPDTPEWKAAHPEEQAPEPPTQPPADEPDPFTFRITGFGGTHNAGAAERDMEALGIEYRVHRQKGHNTLYALFIKREDVARIEASTRQNLKAMLKRRRAEGVR